MMGILLPSLNAARSIAKSTICKSNILQISLANNLYSSDNDNKFILAAADIYATNGGLSRWHGKRATKNDVFDFSKSDICVYLGEGSIKKCPEKVDFVQGQPWDADFEQGGGGYGYNMLYLGSRIWRDGFGACNKATKRNEVRNPSATITFSDTAIAKLNGSLPYYLEYSFVEPPFFASGGTVQKSWGYASPTMHFRHSEKANTVWVDGHVSSEKMIFFDRANVYGVVSDDMMLGWLQLDNELYDLK